MLSQQQIDEFHTRGYTICPGFYDQDEVALLQSEVRRFLKEGLFKNKRTDGDGETISKTHVNLQLNPASKHSEAILALPFSAKVRAAVEELLEAPSVKNSDHIFLKPAHHGTGTAWHQDNAYWDAPDVRGGFGMWIAVDDATIANGTMWIIPGSDAQEYEYSRDLNSNHHIRCYPNEDQAIPIEVAAGGCLLFNFGIAHCTRANNTNRDRAGLAIHYTRCNNIPRKQGYPDKVDSLPVLCGPDYDGGIKAYGRNLEGVWESLVSNTAVRA